jgi:hypothetical protein
MRIAISVVATRSTVAPERMGAAIPGQRDSHMESVQVGRFTTLHDI